LPVVRKRSASFFVPSFSPSFLALVLHNQPPDMPVLGHVKTLECRTSELLTAAADGDDARVKYLLDEEGVLAVHAAQWSPRRILPELARHWPSWGAQPGVCALHAAAEFGHAGVVTSLLARRARPDELTRHGVSALHLASFGGHLEVVSMLLQHDVDPSRRCNDLFGVAGPTPLHFACCCAEADAGAACAALLLAAGASANAVDLSTGRTPLHHAALGLNARLCAMLVRGGGFLQIRDAAERTPVALVRAHHATDDRSAAAAAATLRELHWLPSVHLLWLGYYSGHPLRPLATRGDEVAVREDPAEDAVTPYGRVPADCPLSRLSRDVVRMISEALVDSHAPGRGPCPCPCPGQTPCEEEGGGGARERANDGGGSRMSPCALASREAVSDICCAELALAVRTLHESGP
jgi:hypothetical protein